MKYTPTTKAFGYWKNINQPPMRTFQGTELEKGYTPKGATEAELDPYFPDPGLIQAVNLALFLKRPLLLMGEPGCGKTRLAETVAYALHQADYKTYFRAWHVKSTTKAKEGIYTFDALARLRLSEATQKNEELRNKLKEGGKKLEEFYTQEGILRKGPLAEVFDLSTAANPGVLLIDEVDKADIDFPNDLLLELDKSTYYIPETKTTTAVRSKKDAPLIIITSNNEKELPPAFLRRCLFHYIKFPARPQLEKILDGLFPGDPQAIRDDTLDTFLKIRDRMIQGLSQKKLSTSELIDWFKGLQHHKAQGIAFKDKPIQEALKETLQGLESPQSKVSIPLHQVLLKNWEAIVSILPEEDLQDPPR